MKDQEKEYVVQLEDNDALTSLKLELKKNDPAEAGPKLLLERKVAIVDGHLKIEIFSNEHPPPHFRVIYSGKTANFQISDGKRIIGDLDSRYDRVIKDWHSKNKQTLIKSWDEARPSGCPVGKYEEPKASKK